MNDQNPEFSKNGQLATNAGYMLRHFLNGFFREHAKDDEEINDILFNDAIDRIKEKKSLDNVDDLKNSNREMRIYLEALMKTLKNRINMFDVEIQKEIKKNIEEIMAQEDTPIFEINKQNKEEKRPRFKRLNKNKFDAL